MTAAAKSDPDALPLTDKQLQSMQPARSRGRPVGSTKVATSVRYDIDVVAAFKATGEGWQTRMNHALREYAINHKMLR
ncbi:MAG TPA: BrnA antitoxin family protein [Castellaniella sp.]|uniref:BrnA antitoxin family protein n=1 Tax=Castellaniella sp. TaxID=1955812 RepID=UPI002EF6B8BD